MALSKQTRAEGVTYFIGFAAREFSVLSGNSEVIKVRIHSRNERERASEIAAPKSCFVDALVVKNPGVNLHRLSQPCVRPPLAELCQQTDRIECQAVIW